MAFMLDKSIARIRTPHDKVVGAAFLVAPDLLLTCWHVARQALDDDRLRLDFPTLAAGQMLSARLEKGDEAAYLARSPARTFAVLVQSAFELYRWRLYEALHFPVPQEKGASPSETRRDLSGLTTGMTKQHARADKGASPSDAHEDMTGLISPNLG
ncbi:MAG: hypothetical protein ACOY16_03030 [Chloroflexota bacterium]